MGLWGRQPKRAPNVVPSYGVLLRVHYVLDDDTAWCGMLWGRGVANCSWTSMLPPCGSFGSIEATWDRADLSRGRTLAASTTWPASWDIGGADELKGPRSGRNRGRVGSARGGRGAGGSLRGGLLPAADGGAPLPRGAADDRRDAVVRGAPARRVGGAGRLLGGGAEVRRPRPLDWLGLPRPARPPAPARQQQPLPGAAGTVHAEPGVARAGAVRAARGRQLAGALRLSAAAAGPSSTRRASVAPPTAPRTGPASAACAASAASAAATARRPALPSWSSSAPWLPTRGCS